LSKLTDARSIINSVDEKIIDLFKERMAASKMVAEYKIENNLDIYDSKREDEIIKNNCIKLNDPSIEKYYKELLNTILKVSKDYQKELMKKWNLLYLVKN